ncbi:acyl-CoA dehydrogenase [Actinoplanes sp. ATCC 53533]|uniref:acyl-CoA dehydrogenase family protein n=1 Tax=Actinoplanes sp. ATCC 53533 TaxID=1288362 RepID=UPI000F775FF1|nr:acyl-CoA dehydrogenase family protein [Actinoplanes sp. ATCC 53533]RSM55825.1 acyl-CoA dehydrogenase [Actinoplanes sp. ATCC 53533]
MGPDFRPDEAQETIARLAGEVLDGDADTPERLWKALGSAGLLTLAVPAGLGGAGLGAPETAVVLTEIGRRAAAVPALSTLALGVLPVARWGTAEQQRDLLAGVAEGAVLTAAVAEPADPLPECPRTTVAADWTVTGVKTGVPDADRAHRMLVPARTAAGGVAVMVIDPASPGVSLEAAPGSAGVPLAGAPGSAGVSLAGSPGSAGAGGYTVRLDAVAGQPLGGNTDGRCLADLHRFAIAGACALGDGALAGALGLTAGHVRTRQQFGRPLATFQAVAQQIADVYVTARTLHLAVVAACWALGAGRPADDDLAVAAQWLTAEALPALRTCHHLHGGLGLAADYPLHRHTALVRDLVRFVGGGEHCLQRLGERVARQPG